MEFLDVIESIRSEEASIQRLFGGEGVRAGQRDDSGWKKRVAEVARFVREVAEGRRPDYHLREAMTTSDFPLLFGDVVDRVLLGTYRETPQTFKAYLKIGRVRDFREVKRFAIDGGEAVLSPVPEQDEYPEAALSEARYLYAVTKYGRRIPFSWETIVNGDMDEFSDLVQRLGRAARRTEERKATELLFDANGPHAALFTSGNGNIVNVANGASVNNPALSVSGLQDAFTVLSRQRDADGEPIFIDAVHLVVPPALEIVAQNLLNALQLELTADGGDADRKLVAANWMKNRMQLHVNYYIPTVASTANGDRAWLLLADPGGGRPIAEVGFLRGHEEPDLRIKEANSRRLGGGPVDPLEGDFENDSINYRVRHVVGGGQMDPKAGVASNGSEA